MVNPDTRLVEVMAAIPEHQTGHFVLGSRIIAQFHLPTHSALVVPRSAVLGDGANAYVYRVEQGKAHRIRVTTGIEQSNDIEIRGQTSGEIKAGDSIVTLGNYELQDGMAVRMTH
jgi:multidrug efflux pump subunit AcrA (membrane-fusion protein)